MRSFRVVAAVLTLGLNTIALAQAVPAAKQPTRQIAFSPDGNLLAVAFGEINQPGSLVVWEWRSKRRVFVHPESVGVASVEFSPGGDLLAIGMFGPAAKLISPNSGEVVRQFRGHANHVRSVSFVSDRVLATGSYDRTIRLWDVASGNQIAELGRHDDQLRDIAASPDGKWLITGGSSPDARLWNVKERVQAAVFQPSDLICSAVGFSRDGTLFITGRLDATVRIRETLTHVLRAAIRTSNRGFDLSPDNRTLLVFNDRPTIQLFAVTLSPPSDDVQQEIERLIAVWLDDDYREREAASEQLIALGLLAEPQLRAAMESDSVEVRIRARRARVAVLSPQAETVNVGHAARVGAVRFSPQGSVVASGDADGIVKVWRVKDRSVVAEFRQDE